MTIRTPCATVSLEQGVVVVRFDQGVSVDAAEMRRILEAQAQLGAKLVLVDARPVKDMSREAQEISAKDGVPGTIAVAILIDGPVSVVLGNFFLRLQRPPYATRLFRGEVEARRWLLQR
jgi:hypothetical protein